jgi:UDP-N-acetylmuramoyl-L-alanyl-D-glutamate--2,6-diaminopimelate ligase
LEHEPERVVKAEEVALTAKGSTFRVEDQPFSLRLIGGFNVENALAAIAVGLAYGVPLDRAAAALAAVKTVPGRMESIDAGQDFAAIVDYAPEPESFRQLYKAIGLLERPKRIIHVLGSCGGGRDRDRRPVLGRLAAENADIVIVTNEDPYDDDPREIIDQVAAGAAAAGKRDNENLFRIEDRREALAKAVGLAQAGDLVLATGKGAEQAICGPNGSKEPWDERVVLREVIVDRLAVN